VHPDPARHRRSLIGAWITTPTRRSWAPSLTCFGGSRCSCWCGLAVSDHIFKLRHYPPRRLHALAGDDERPQGSEATRHPDRQADPRTIRKAGGGEDLGPHFARETRQAERGSTGKRLKVTVAVEDDILVRPRDLHRQATEEHSHYYVGRCVGDGINCRDRHPFKENSPNRRLSIPTPRKPSVSIREAKATKLMPLIFFQRAAPEHGARAAPYRSGRKF
jgi:hypothetical protein